MLIVSVPPGRGRTVPAPAGRCGLCGLEKAAWSGRGAGHRILASNRRFVRPQYVASAQAFFDRYGKRSIVLAHFVPIVRTFVPFLAGVGTMQYRWFVSYNAIGAISWVLIIVRAGYFFGTVPIVRDNLSLVFILIVVATFAAIGVGILRRNGKKIGERHHRET